MIWGSLLVAKRSFKPTNSFKRDLKKHYLELIGENWAIVITCLANNIPMLKNLPTIHCMETKAAFVIVISSLIWF